MEDLVLESDRLDSDGRVSDFLIMADKHRKSKRESLRLMIIRRGAWN